MEVDSEQPTRPIARPNKLVATRVAAGYALFTTPADRTEKLTDTMLIGDRDGYLPDGLTFQVLDGPCMAGAPGATAASFPTVPDGASDPVRSGNRSNGCDGRFGFTAIIRRVVLLQLCEEP